METVSGRKARRGFIAFGRKLGSAYRPDVQQTRSVPVILSIIRVPRLKLGERGFAVADAEARSCQRIASLPLPHFSQPA